MRMLKISDRKLAWLVWANFRFSLYCNYLHLSSVLITLQCKATQFRLGAWLSLSNESYSKWMSGKTGLVFHNIGEKRNPRKRSYWNLKPISSLNVLLLTLERRRGEKTVDHDNAHAILSTYFIRMSWQKEKYTHTSKMGDIAINLYWFWLLLPIQMTNLITSCIRISMFSKQNMCRGFK